jgi:hypothetical protein
MSRRVPVVLAAAVILAFGFVAALNLRAKPFESRTAVLEATRPIVKYDERTVRDRDIVFFAKRIAEDPENAIDRMVLARLYFARSRNSGSMADLAEAERLAKESIERREHRN